MTDPIADYLTRLRNAIQAKHRVVEVPASNLKKTSQRFFEKTTFLIISLQRWTARHIIIALKYRSLNAIKTVPAFLPLACSVCRLQEIPSLSSWCAILSTSNG